MRFQGVSVFGSSPPVTVVSTGVDSGLGDSLAEAEAEADGEALAEADALNTNQTEW